MPAVAAIVRRPLHHPGTGWQGVANTTYLAAARELARIIGRHGIVRSVTLRRSAAAGEVRFGRSDIDLGIVLHTACASPGETRQLFALNRTVRYLRVAFPWLGQCEVLAAEELAEWAELESFRIALDLGTGVLLHGEPVAYPIHPITPAQAAYRTAFWFENYLPRALRNDHRTNLWKFTLEMWSTCGLALGRLTAPPLSRSDTLAAWRAQDPQAGPPDPAWSTARLWQHMLALTAELHSTLLPPLRAPEAMLTHSLILPPSFTRRTLIVGTAAHLVDYLPRLSTEALPLTPEALGLYLEFVNPALFDLLPPQLLALGFRRPSSAAWQAVLRRWSCPILARKPGFGGRGFGTAPRQVLYGQRAAAALRAGAATAGIRLADLGPAARMSPPFREYFLQHYPAVLAAGRAARGGIA